MSILKKIREYIVDSGNSHPSTPHQLQCNNADEQLFRNGYFKEKNSYFKSLLGKRLEGRDCLIDSDMPILKEAYDKAHLKVQFEIDLHWRRTTHIWTLILALLVATGTILGLYLTAKNEQKYFYAVITLILSIISIFASRTSLAMLNMSHKWCQNWELHVVILEPLFAGKLYQTHLGIGKKRPSMSKLNNIFIWIAFSCWMTLFEISILVLSSNIINFLIATIITYAFMSFSYFLIGHAILSEDEKTIHYELTQYGATPIDNNDHFYYLKINLKNIKRQLTYFISFISAMLIATFLLVHYTSTVEINLTDLPDLLKMNTNILIPYLF